MARASVSRSMRTNGPEPMLDAIYIISGIAVVGVFALYAIGLRRV